MFHASQTGWGDEAVGCPLNYEIKHKRKVETITAHYHGSQRAPRRKSKMIVVRNATYKGPRSRRANKRKGEVFHVRR